MRHRALKASKKINVPPSAERKEDAVSDLRGHRIVVCICGGIAAYKTATLVSRLVQSGADVRVAMTENAQRFVGPLTFRALTGNEVYTDAWRSEGNSDIHHLSLSENAELMVVAPATANTLAKVANGIADELVSAMLLGASCPILAVPAMNNRMWEHPATQRNLTFLRDEAGVQFVGPDEGWLACRTNGPGRMSEPDAIFDAIATRLRADAKAK